MENMKEVAKEFEISAQDHTTEEGEPAVLLNNPVDVDQIERFTGFRFKLGFLEDKWVLCKSGRCRIRACDSDLVKVALFTADSIAQVSRRGVETLLRLS